MGATVDSNSNPEIMESRYGIGINNRYAMFLDSEDGEDLILPKKKAVTEAKDQPMLNKVEAKTAQPVKKVVPEDPKLVKSQTPTKPNQKTNTREDKENRNNRFEGKRVLDARKPQEGPRESREERNNRRNKQGESGAPFDAEKGGRGGLGRGAGRGGGRGRGGDRGGRGGRGGKRDFDRKSGDDKTGVKPVDKKDGNGSHNWGTFEDEIKAEDDKASVSASDESPPENTEQKEKTEGEVTELDAEAEAKKAAEEEEARTMTLDEWKAQQAGAKEDKPK